MKNFTLLFTFLIGASFSFSQNILFVDDNDNITDNSDTIKASIQATTYSSFDYYNVADSTSTPSFSLLSQYDLVIWYASTDGSGLGFWVDGPSGNVGLVDYLTNNGRLWVIGSDLLYAGFYSAPTTFSAGDFTYDYMGLESYNAQSFGDDGGIGVSSVYKLNTAPTYFPDSLDWIFPTAYWFDGVTPRSGAENLYEMGPSTYALSGEISMFHYKGIQTNTLSTYFDPALISNYNLRKTFMEKSIFYILNFDLGIEEMNKANFSIYPNPVQNEIELNFEQLNSNKYSITSGTGMKVQEGTFSGKSIELNKLDAGVYLLTIDGKTQRFIKL